MDKSCANRAALRLWIAFRCKSWSFDRVAVLTLSFSKAEATEGGGSMRRLVPQ
jgi:hypothetical protein